MQWNGPSPNAQQGGESVTHGRVAQLYPGQGSQYVGMGKALYQAHLQQNQGEAAH